ncbi:MAG: GldG family protein [Patescibacteria group bacterium]
MLFTRFDFTAGQIYTLSNSTRQIVDNLPEGIEIKAFVSNNLPAQYVTSKNQLLDKLDEYRNISGKLSVNIYDPVNDTAAASLAEALGIPSLDLQAVEKDQYQVVKAYFGLAVLKHKSDASNPSDNSNSGPLADYEKQEVLPVIQSLNSLEYDLGSMLLKVGSNEQMTIGFLTGHGEHGFASANSYFTGANVNPRDDYTIWQTLSRNYHVIQIDLSAAPAVENSDNQDPLASVDTLVIAGPTQAFSEEDINQIHNFVQNGGQAILLIDSMNVDLQYSLSASTLPENYQQLLAPWGVRVDNKLVADANNDMASFNQGYVTYSLPYPYFAKVTDLSEDNVITRDLESITLPWTSPLDITDIEGVSIEKIAYSSPHYNLVTENTVAAPADTTNLADETDTSVAANPATQTEPIDLNPQQDFNISSQAKDPVTLAVIAKKNNEGQVLIMGDSDFLSQNFPGNEIFFQNAVDTFTLGDTLIQIRSKNITDRPLRPLTETKKDTIRWGLIIGIPLLFVLYGIFRRWQRVNLKNASQI